LLKSFFAQVATVFTYPKASIKNVLAQEKLSALNREHPALEFYFQIFGVIFALLDSDPDPGTRLNPDPQHCFLVIILILK
jgi:hypothetical protein